MRQWALKVLSGLLLLPSAAALAQYVSLTVDNDFFARADRHYTGGLQLGLLLEAPAIPSSIRALPPVAWSADPRLTFAFGQRIYTPSDLDRQPADPDDRPYAGWSYVLADVRTKQGQVVDHLSASVGVVGPGSGARQVQRITHRIFGSRAAEGWRSQLHNEVGGFVGFERTWMELLRANSGSRQVDLSARAGGVAGNVFTYAGAGLVLRYGRNLPDELPGSISLEPTRDTFAGSSGRGWFAWLGVDARAVARNIFLDGNTFQDSASVDRKRFVYDVQAGVAYSWSGTRLGFALVRRSQEFSGQHGPDRYGQLTLSSRF